MASLTTSFLSTEGRTYFNQARHKELYWSLSVSFLTQETQTYCGVASSVCVLNALPVSKPITPPYAPHAYFTQDNYFSPAVEQIVPKEQVKEEGMMLNQLSLAIQTWGVSAMARHASDWDVNMFRDEAGVICADASRALIINFNRPALGQEGGGHFSPIAAYDEHSDSFLLMDVARYKYPPVWVRAEVLFQAMNTIDRSSGMSRGWCTVSVSDTQSSK